MQLALNAAPTRPSPAVGSCEALPSEVAQLLASPSDERRETAWQAFVERYSRLMLKVAFAFAPGYDGAMDRYLFILEELRRDDNARLRRFAADGRGRFSTWLVVVTRRLCVDHYRHRYGRERTDPHQAKSRTQIRQVRRRLAELTGDGALLDSVMDQVQSDPLEALDHETQCRSLHRAIQLLDPGDRLLLRLRYEEDLTAREIATLLGLPTPFHVYRRIRGVCALLKERMSPSIPPGPACARPVRTGEPSPVQPQRCSDSNVHLTEGLWHRY